MQESIVPGVTLKRMEGFRVAYVRHRGSAAEIGLSFQRLLRLLRKTGLRPAGPMIAFHRHVPSAATAEAEGSVAAVPVTRDALGEDDLRFMDVPPAEVASLIYEGPPTRFGETYAVLRAWMEAEGFLPAGTIREIYARDLSELPPGIVYVEVQVPVRRKSRGEPRLIAPRDSKVGKG